MVDTSIRRKVEDAGWKIDWAMWDALSPYEKSFFILEFTELKTIEYYEKRLKAIQFDNIGKVLDVACGMGQWSAAMARLGSEITGVDLNTGRLHFSHSLMQSMNLKHNGFHYASMEMMDYPDEQFEGIFCYGSFMFGDVNKTLAEFNRLLKSSGRVYLNANAAGWYLHLLIDRGIKKFDIGMIRTALSMTARTLLNKPKNAIILKKRIEKKFHEYGFHIVAVNSEGCINLNPDHVTLPQATYPATYYGVPSIYEFVLEKK